MITTSTVPQAVSTYYDRSMLVKARPLLVHSRWATIRDIPKGNGDSIRFRRYALLTPSSTPLVEGVTPTLDTLSVVNVDATIQQYGRGFLITDKLLFTTLDPLLMEVADILGENAGETLDLLVREAIAVTTTIQYAGAATTNGTVDSTMKISKAEIMEAVRTLKNNKARRVTSMVSPSTGYNSAPISAAYIGIVHPNTTFDLKNDAAFVPVEKYATGANIMEGEVGKLDEVRFIETTSAKVYTGAGSGGIDVYATIIMGQDFYAMTRISGEAMHNYIDGPGGNADPLHQRQTSAWKATFVAKVLNDAFGLSLRHAVTP